MKLFLKENAPPEKNSNSLLSPERPFFQGLGNDGGTEKLETSPDGSRCEKKRKVLFFCELSVLSPYLNIKVTTVLEFGVSHFFFVSSKMLRLFKVIKA